MGILDIVKRPGQRKVESSAEQCREKFLRFFPRGFEDRKYFDWERSYKMLAHQQWQQVLNRKAFQDLLKLKKFAEIASEAIRVESRTNLLFSFEKMALRDAVREREGAETFSRGLYDILFSGASPAKRFDRWCGAIESLPRKQTRVLTHPAVTVFPFIAQPERHIFLKPNVTRKAAAEYGFDFRYKSKPGWDTYSSLLEFAQVIKSDLARMKPRDMIDVQSFIWVIGSEEYS